MHSIFRKSSRHLLDCLSPISPVLTFTSQIVDSAYSAPTLVALACISLIVVGTLVSACDSVGIGDDESNNLIPLNEGNRWDAIEKGPDGDRRHSVAVQATSDTSASATFGDPDDSSSLSIRKNKNGVLVGFTLDGHRNMLLKYPVEDGDKYQYTDEAGRNTFQVSVSKKSISVPAGTYDCLMYRIVQIRSEYQNVDRVCIKPRLGPVFWSREGVRGLNTVLELNSTNVEE